MQVVERWILARLRHQTFFSLDELNRAIAELLVSLNERTFKKLPGSRRSLFEHYYSVPYQLVKLQLDARISAHTVELFHRAKRVASHRRSNLPARHTTVVEHMPRPHREYAEWTPKRLIDWARQSGPHTAQLVSHILSSPCHPQQGFRSCLGILRLAKTYSKERLEAACHRALTIGATTYKSVESILKHNLDSQPLPKPAASSLPITHDNLRGPDYFH